MRNRACGCACTHAIHNGLCAKIEAEPACNSIKGTEDSVVSSAMEDFSDLLSILSMHHVPSGLTSIGESNMKRDLSIIADHWSIFDKENSQCLLGKTLSPANRDRKRVIKESAPLNSIHPTHLSIRTHLTFHRVSHITVRSSPDTADVQIPTRPMRCQRTSATHHDVHRHGPRSCNARSCAIPARNS